MNFIQKNLFIRGGAKKLSAYLCFLKEVLNKDLKFYSVSGSSAGSLMTALIGIAKNYEHGVNLLKKIKADKSQKLFSKVETEKNIFKKLFYFCLSLPGIRWVFFNSVENILRREVSWKKIEKKGRIKNPYFTAIRVKDVVRAFGKDIIDDLKNGRKIKLDMDCKKMLEIIPIYYFSNVGVYKVQEKNIFKIPKIIPAYKSLLSSFWNPVFRPYKIRLYKRREQFMDAGLIDNYGNLIYKFLNIESNCLSCEKKPKKKKDYKGIKDINSYCYHLYPAKKFFEVEYTGEKGFLSFWDENIDKESKKKQTNFYG